jgi:hypothetical protein
MQCCDEFGYGESCGSGAGYEFGGELRELAVALGGGAGGCGVFGDEGSGSLLGVEDAAELHLAVGTGYGVGIDGEVDSYAADRGELVASAKGSSGYGGENLVDELAVDGDPAVRVEAKGEAGGYGIWCLIHSINVLVD